MKSFLSVVLMLCVFSSKAQKIENISFNLYTDSLKKGVHNYINVDGQLAGGKFYPLMDSEVSFSSSAGTWVGNSLIIDSAYNKDSVVVTAVLKSNPQLVKNITIYIKKGADAEVLKTEAELLEGWRNKRKGKSIK